MDDVVARAEKLSAEAVSHVFLTLCGTAEAPDKFTGMQVRAWLLGNGSGNAAVIVCPHARARRPDARRALVQREMNLYIKRIIEAAVQAGQEAGKKELAREQYRNSKALQNLEAGYKAQAKASEDRRVAVLVARVDTMCNSLRAEKEQFERSLKEFERASLAMKERAVLQEKQGKDWAEQMAALRRELKEARAQVILLLIYYFMLFVD